MRGGDGRLGVVALAALGTLACGARTELEVDPATDPARDGGRPRDGAPRECELRTDGEPITVLSGPDTRYESPQVVARLGGLDVVAARVGPSGLDHVARRIRIDGAVRVEGDEVVVGPNARSSGAVGSDGERLAIGWGDDFLEEPTRFAIYEGTGYRPTVRATIGDGAGDFCVAMHPLADHWLAAWSDRTVFATVAAELDDGGRILSSPLPVDSLAATALHADGVVLARAALDRVYVSFYGIDAVAEASAPTRLPADSASITSSPFAADAVELAWYSPTGAAEILRLHRNGRVEAALPFEVPPVLRTGPVLETFAGRVAVARGDETAGGDGVIRLYVRERDGALSSELAVDTTSPALPVLLADGDRLYLVWNELHDFTTVVKLLPLRC